MLSVLNLGEFAQIFSKMGMFPVFDLAYYIVSILYLKYEPGERTPSVCTYTVSYCVVSGQMCALLFDKYENLSCVLRVILAGPRAPSLVLKHTLIYNSAK